MRAKFNQHQAKAADLCAFFISQGFETYWVGGAVRDMLLSKSKSETETTEIDFATSAKPAEIKKLLRTRKLKTYDVGEKFGTIGAILPTGTIEITTFRAEQNYSDSRHPKKVVFQEFPEIDSERRDFTINALYFNPLTGDVLDFHNGLKDLKNKRLRFVGKAEKRIKEDPLRLMRAVRFGAKLNFKIVDIKTIKKSSRLIKKISAERIKNELDKILSDRNYLQGIELLNKTNLLKQILPEVEKLKKQSQSKNVHAEGNVFIHSFLVLKEMEKYDLDLRYAGLFHDLGKFGTAKKTKLDGRPHISFHGHAELGAERFREIAKRLRFPQKQRDKIYTLIRDHMKLARPHLVTHKTLVKWAQMPHFKDLIRLRIADGRGGWKTNIQGKRIKKDFREWEELLNFEVKVKKIVKNNLINGNDVMRIKKIKPSPRVGEILASVKEKQILGEIKTKKDAEKFVKSLDN